MVEINQPRCVDDDKVSHFSLLDGAVSLGAADGVGRVDGGGCQRLVETHPLVHSGQMHHEWLKYMVLGRFVERLYEASKSDLLNKIS